MQPNTSPGQNHLYLTSPLLELPPNILTFRLTDCKHEIRHGLVKKSTISHHHSLRITTHIAICVALSECHGNSPHRVKSKQRQILYVTSPPAVQGANLASCGVEGSELIDTVVIDTAVISFPSSRRLQMYFSSTIISSHTAWSRYRHFHRNRYGGAADRVEVAMSLLSSLRLVQPLSAAVHD